MAKRRPAGDGMVRKREDGRWEGRIHRCIKNALGTDVPNNECQILFRETVKKLKDSGYPDLTVRNLDSVIWNKYQKNRSIF